MYGSITSLEIFRWGFAHLPGAIFYYAKELELDPEDIGLLATLFFAFENIKPLFQAGVTAGQVLKCCPAYTSAKLGRRLNILVAKRIIGLSNGQTRSLVDKTIYLEPLMDRLEQLIIRDHPELVLMQIPAPAEETVHMESVPEREKPNNHAEAEGKNESQKSVDYGDEEDDWPKMPVSAAHEEAFRKIADFIAKKSGNLISVKMSGEIKKWLCQLELTPDFLFIMLELCFERQITGPQEISRIAADLSKYEVASVEGLNMYFKKYIDADREKAQKKRQFDPELIDFGSFIGIDMNAEARKRLYYKWRFEWQMERDIVMKAGELMCQRTTNGGLEYIDSVLSDWASKGLKSIPEVEAEIAAFKKSRKDKKKSSERPGSVASYGAKPDSEYSVYIPPELMNNIKKTPGGQ